MPPELPDPAGAEPARDPGTSPVTGSGTGAVTGSGDGGEVEGGPSPEAGPAAGAGADATAPEEGTAPAAGTAAEAGAAAAEDPEHQAKVRRLITLAVAAVLLIAIAVVLAFANHSARANGPLANEAFVDEGSTSAVEAEITAAIKTVYSYDYRTLDANQAAAKAVTTGQFAQDFDKVFDAVKQLAPKEQAVMTTAVPAAGVLQLKDDRARLLMMVDQNGTKGGTQPIGGASARLIVEAQRVDGRWKIAEVTPE